MHKPEMFNFSVKDLTDSDSPDVAVDKWVDVPKSPLTMTPSLGEGAFEIWAVRPGMAISRSVTHLAPHEEFDFIPLANVEMVVDEPTLTLHSAVKGNVLHKDRFAGREQIYTSEQAVLGWSDYFDLSREHVPGLEDEFYSVVLTRTILRELLGERNAAKLLYALKFFDGPKLESLKLPQMLSASLHSSLRIDVSSEMKRLFLSAKILEFATLFSDFIIGDKLWTPVSPQRTKRVRQLYDELMHLKGATPNLNELSDKYGMSARSLNDAFRKEYGDSIYSFSKKQRLQNAHDMMVHSDTPMKVVAAECGYEHVGNFMIAFKQFFGYPPGSLRR